MAEKERTAEEMAADNGPDVHELIPVSIHLPANGSGHAAMELVFPNGAKKTMNRLQTNKEADDYPHVRGMVSRRQAAQLTGYGYVVRELKSADLAAEKAEAEAKTTGRERAESARSAKKK